MSVSIPRANRGICAPLRATLLPVLAAARPRLCSLGWGLRRFGVLSVGALILGACSDGGSAPAPVEMTINVPAATVELGGNVQLSVRNARGEVSWSSSNTSVATVVSTGFVTAVGAGSSVITAQTSAQTASTTVTVPAPPAIAVAASTIAFTARAGAANPGARSIAITNSGPGTLQGLTVEEIRYAAGQPGAWLSATLSATSATTAQPSALQLSATVSALTPGVYTATVMIGASNAPNSPAQVTVTFTVTAAPTIELSAATAQFTAVTGGANPAASTIAVTSGANDPATGLAASIAYGPSGQTGWLTATLSATSTPSVLTLQATTGARPAGTHTATITLTSPDAPPRTILVTFTVSSPPRIDVSATSIAFSADLAGASPAAQIVQLTNGGGGTLNTLSTLVQYTNGAAWLSATLNTTTAPASLTLQANAAGLSAGSYLATVRVNAPGASNSPRDISVTLTVSSGPLIVVASPSLSFSSTTGASPSAQVVAISNGGGGILSGLSTTLQYTGTAGWLTATLNTSTAPATLTVQPSHTGLSAGTYTATIRVNSAVASNSPVSILVTYTVAQPATIALSATSAAFTGVSGGGNPSPEQITISNSGGGSLTSLSTSISYGSGSGWLTATLNTTTAPATLTLTATPGALPLGTYTATVSVLSPVATNSPRTIAVTLNIASPLIGLSATSRSASAGQGNGNTAVTAIAVTNVGAGTLTGLAASITYLTGPSSGWLTATLNTSTAPATLTLVPSAGTAGAPLATGTYTARVRITSPVASNSPQDILMTFTVGLSLANSGVFSALGGACTACHFSGGELPNLSTAALFRSNMVGVATVRRTGYALATTYPTRVVAGNATLSYLTYQLSKAGGAYGMPPASTLSLATRNLISAWINDGAHP